MLKNSVNIIGKFDKAKGYSGSWENITFSCFYSFIFLKKNNEVCFPNVQAVVIAFTSDMQSIGSLNRLKG